MSKHYESSNFGYPYVSCRPSYTKGGTAYLEHPTVALVSKPKFDLDGMTDWVSGFRTGHDSDFDDNIDSWINDIRDKSNCTDAEQGIKAGGQLCYLSALGKYTKNADMQGYLDNILGSKHFSVTEHANWTFFFGGVSRSWSHEAVRHRHLSPSQLSQRYVDGRALRFVIRPEYIGTSEVERFEKRCDFFAEEYEDLAKRLISEGIIKTEGMSRTDQRKAVNQVARELLPNSTETAAFFTGNASAWRHFLSIRGTGHAETEIRRTTWFVAKFLKDESVAPKLFNDVEIGDDWRDGVIVGKQK